MPVVRTAEKVPTDAHIPSAARTDRPDSDNAGEDLPVDQPRETLFANASQAQLISGNAKVRRGSTVRVRQRPLQSAQIGAFSVESLARPPICGGCLHRLVTLPFRDLRVPTGEQLRFGAGTLVGGLLAVRHGTRPSPWSMAEVSVEGVELRLVAPLQPERAHLGLGFDLGDRDVKGHLRRAALVAASANPSGESNSVRELAGPLAAM
jgi:hypothetical protein